MLISSKGQYALRLMVDISINSGSTVLRAIEGRISPIDNRVDEDGDTNMVMNDVIGEVWDDLESAINNVLDNKTIADLTREYSDRIGYMYSI